MHLIRRILNFYIFSNIHVALGVLCFVKITLLSFAIDENDVGFFVFFATILSYNFIRFLNIPIRKNWVTSWFVENKFSLVILSAVSAIGCIYLVYGFSIDSILVLIPFVILTFFYGMKLPKSLVSLRRIPGLKIFLIAFCFAGITVLFPLVENKIEINSKVWMLFIQRILFVVLITIPFDIRDVIYDSQSLKTLPQYLGIRMSKIVGIVLGVLVIIMEYKYDLGSMMITLTVTALALLLLIFSRKKQTKYYSSFFVESIPIIWFVLLLVERSLNK